MPALDEWSSIQQIDMEVFVLGRPELKRKKGRKKRRFYPLLV